ncbi:MAG: M3 family oligoendopeptidase, partial [Candidatus Hodarchaeales archaeon]
MNSQNELVWDLSVLFKSATDPKIEQTIQKVLYSFEMLTKEYTGRINREEFTPLALKALLERIDNLYLVFNDVFVYGSLAIAIDITDPTRQQLYTRIDEVVSILKSHMNLLELEIGALFIGRTSEFLESSSLQAYTQYLQRISRKHQYCLSEKEEGLSNVKDLYGVIEWGNLAQIWKNSRQFSFNIEREQKTLTWGQAFRYFTDSDRNIRKKAITQIFTAFAEDKLLYSSCFRNIFANYAMMASKRGCPSPLTLTLIEDDVTHPIISNMIKAIDRHIPLFHEVLQLKARFLSLEQLQGEDISELPILAPVTYQDSSEYSWEEAKALIVETYSEFDEDMTSILEELFTHKRIDAIARPERIMVAGSCFPWFSKESAFVMVDFRGSMTDVIILAHELGHAVHFSLSNREQGYLNSLTSLVLMETASEFSSKLVTQKLLQKNLSKEMSIAMLLNTLELQLIFIFVYGALRFRFQESVHKALEAGEYLNAEKLTELYKNARHYYYGDLVEFYPCQDKYWTFIPMFYSSEKHYYNYQYAFGQLFVQILFATYREDKAGF